MIFTLIIIYIVICLILSIIKKVNETAASSRKYTKTEKADNSSTLIDEDAPINMTRSYTCDACGGKTVINHSVDHKYVCQYCNSRLFQAERAEERIRRERRMANLERKDQFKQESILKIKEMEHDRYERALEAEKEKEKMEHNRKIISIAFATITLIVILILVLSILNFIK